MSILSSIRFLLAALVVTSDFVHIFTDAQLEKWALDVPVGTYNGPTNRFTLTFEVDDSITQANIAATVWDPVGLEGGNQLLDADGINRITTSVVTTGEATLTFDLNLEILKENVNVFTDLPAQNEAEMKVCARFMLFTDDGSIEVNFVESIVTLTIDLVSEVATSIGVEKKVVTKNTSDKSYGVDAYLCDPNNPSEELTISFQQGSAIKVCMTPQQAALDDGIRMKSIDSFSWSKGLLASQSAIDNNGPANVLTSNNCVPNSIYCDIKTILKADFYRTTDAPTTSPTLAPTPTPSESTPYPTWYPTPDSGGGGYGGGGYGGGGYWDTASPILSPSTPDSGGRGYGSGAPTPTFPPTGDGSNPGFIYYAYNPHAGYLGAYGDECINGGAITSEMTIDFSTSTVLENDLFGGGLRYGNIGYIPGTGAVDLVITSTDYLNENADASGLDDSENFGKIGFETEFDTQKSKGTFDFCFVQPNTADSVVTVDRFQWSVFDLDTYMGMYGSPFVQEKILIDMDQVSAFSIYPAMSGGTNLYISCENDGSLPPCSNSRTVFTGQAVGNSIDNPTDPTNLTEQQMKRSVVFHFENTACWTVEFNALCESWGCQSYTGAAKFFFSGGASQIVEDGTAYCPYTNGYRRSLTSEYSKDNPVDSEGSSDSSKNYSADSDNGSSDFSSNDFAVEKRNLEEEDVVVGAGSCTLMLSRRRRLNMDERDLQAERALQADPTAPVELIVDLVSVDDGYSLRQTAGGLSRRFGFFFIVSVLANAAILLL